MDNSAYMQERREFYISHNICPVCGQNDIQKGYSYCLQCRMRQRDYNEKARNKLTEKQREERKKQKREFMKKLADARKAAGMCVRCGKRKTENKFVCELCSAKWAKRRRDKNHEREVLPVEILGDGNHCSTCGKPPMKDKKLCERCYTNILKTGEIGRSKINNQNHIWRKENAVIFKRKCESEGKP